MKLALPVAALAIASIGIAGCETVMEQQAGIAATAQLKQRTGLPAGVASVFDEGGKLTVSVALAGLSPGVHAVHLHTKGDCSAEDFTSAGGHLNPAGKQHGSLNPAGSHLGDLPNATLDSQGKGVVSATLAGTSSEALAALFDADGTAIVVHEKADDYRSDPAGDAGSRVACGVLSMR